MKIIIKIKKKIKLIIIYKSNLYFKLFKKILNQNIDIMN